MKNIRSTKYASKIHIYLIIIPLLIMIVSLITIKPDRHFYSKSDYHFNLINNAKNPHISAEKKANILAFKESF